MKIMKKYIVLVAFVFAFVLFGFNTKPVSAYDSGCMPGDLFSRTTGQSCSTLPPACAPGDLFSSLTGQACSPTTIGSSSSVVVSSLSPTTGAVGASVTITGSGFTSTNNTVDFGGGYLSGFSSTNGTSITFTVPSSLGGCPPPSFGSQAVTACPMIARIVNNGNYDVSVINANGKSATVSFAVTGGVVISPTPIPPKQPCSISYVGGAVSNSNVVCVGQPQPVQPPKVNPLAPVVSGVSGPQTLDVNGAGTWTVTASDPSNGNLSYGVDWGDAAAIAYPMNTSQVTPVTQQSATFTHTYATAEIYNPIFTVTDAGGLTAQTSLSVNVGNVTPPTIGPCSNMAGATCPPTSPTPPCDNIVGDTCPPTQPQPIQINACVGGATFSTANGQPCEVSGGSGYGSASGGSTSISGSASGSASGNGISPTQTSPSPVTNPTGPLPVPPMSCTISSTLKLGSTGTDVSCLQEKLGLSADGKFGPQTKAAVSAFQAKLGLTSDGIFGPKSIPALNNSTTTTTQ
jgi:hypothetical protein